jgi:hypothetical protein
MQAEPTDPFKIRPATCPDCQEQMRFVASLPDGIEPALWHVMFKCDCGRSSDQVITQDLIETRAEQKG